MHVEMLDILRCPFCGARPELVGSVFHRRTGDEIHDGVLQCRCCWFPIVAGIPVMHRRRARRRRRWRTSQAGRPDLARRTMFNLDGERAERFEEIVASDTASYADVVDALGPNYERGYFLYRFSDPSYVVAHALVRAVAGVVLRDGGRAIDICGGSGHLTRALMDLSSSPPVLADLYFAKVWLGRQFTAPGCEGVCCHAEAPMPFRRGAFRYAMCADAFMFIWTKRRLVQEMLRLIDDDHDMLVLRSAGARSADRRERRTRHERPKNASAENVERPGAVVISHTHNQLQWSESLGQALPPDGYRNLFETVEPRVFSEAALFADVVKGRTARSGAERLSRSARGRPGAHDCRHPQSRRLQAASTRAGLGRARRDPVEPAVRGRASGTTGCGCDCNFPRASTRKNSAPAASTCPRSSTSNAPRSRPFPRDACRRSSPTSPGAASFSICRHGTANEEAPHAPGVGLRHSGLRNRPEKQLLALGHRGRVGLP